MRFRLLDASGKTIDRDEFLEQGHAVAWAVRYRLTLDVPRLVLENEETGRQLDITSDIVTNLKPFDHT